MCIRDRLEGYPADGAQELAMDTLLRGLHYSRYAILREVVENEFADEVPEEKREAFVLKLLPLVGNVFSVYDPVSYTHLMSCFAANAATGSRKSTACLMRVPSTRTRRHRRN